ncbi:melanoma-associated antigen 8 [Heterocephalus glaber]|uniref:Melanoma-associated antigen 8 n=1 Tax=Heterocephalus glaber TaxID=10181 RepID=A0AAX6S9Y4_HETGA|nr:melanoma-associated antigen 8 [Heterocephalus glaber]XP_021104828.1 melanoma-associated antigen 8 [Heterocephalus glaber]XP_021104829.1 melanoma-associated antigen 8 [Heterocephalus glaber]XP_021104830.1 melanoma-associated antigen 8 [Heterocephalus glaber]XP_021104831.1 melanoma-associated antigen 8 [Heterocephalus glaber]
MMPHGQRSEDRNLVGGHPTQSSAGDIMGMQGLKEKVREETVATVSSASSSSYNVIRATPREAPGPETLSCLQNPQGISSPPSAMASSQSNPSSEGSSRKENQGARPLQDMDVPQFLRNVLLNDKLRKLVSFLLRKYQKKEQVTLEEMLHVVHDDYREHFPLIFREVCESICLGFGIELREVDPPGHTYVLVPVLGLTYNGILDNDDQIIPKFDLLIYTLTAVFMRGNQVSEKVLKKQVIKWGMLALKEHIVIRELWKFITEDLVQEQYLVYRQVPDSDPANYEFLWGPRAHAETTQMKVLEHVAKLNRADPRSYPQLYDQALREESGMFRAHEEQDV